jgi:hypothetical protein
MPEGSENGASGDAALSRREFVIGGGAVGALALGSAGVYLSMDEEQSEAEATYLVKQGKLRWEVNPLSVDDRNVREFYDYDDTHDTSGDLPEEIIETNAASRLFVYSGPIDNSLVFHHGSPDVDHGGTARFSFSGLSRDGGEWAVRDDPVGVDDDYEPWEGGNQVVEWGWGAGKTDGGAFYGALDRTDFTITITPKTLRGVEAWRFLSGSVSDPRGFELYDEKPVNIKPTKGGKSVERVNVEIMPDSEDNAFDPYGKGRITVAVRSPPDSEGWAGPGDIDPGNYAVNFGSRSYLAGGNAAQPQSYTRRDGDLFLEYKINAANFTLDSAYGFLVGKTGENTWFRGRDVVRPGGFDNTDDGPAGGELAVADVNAEPDGDALSEEYVGFENIGSEAIDMTGYEIHDESGATFVIPEGFTLGSGESFRLYTESGEDSETALYWGRSQPVWNDDGDTIVVEDDASEVVLEYAYPRP